MDSRGAAPRPSSVREMANLVLVARGSTPVISVGENWVTNFVKRHPILIISVLKTVQFQACALRRPEDYWRLVFSRPKNDPSYGINPDDIYNFDETGFAMGLITTAKVITRREYYGRRALLQPGNRAWVTTIECINASGWALPPCVIFKGKVFIESWFDGSRTIGASRLARTDGLLMKLVFGGLTSSLFRLLLRVRRGSIDF